MSKKLLFVMNPRAGLRRANRFLCDILSLYAKAGWNCTVQMTTENQRGKEIVELYGKEADHIVCAGGDGTLNEVIAGIVSSSLKCSIGYIPCGSTNDFALSLKLPRGIMEAARVAVGGTVRRIDSGNFNGRHFNYTASAGSFTKVSYSVPQNVKNSIGRIAYLLETLKEIPEIHPIHLRFEADGILLEGEYLFACACNSTSLAGILKFKKELVDLSDGLLEFLLIKEPANIVVVAEIIQCLQNMKYDHPNIQLISTKKAVITTDIPIDWSLDGELEANVRRAVIENVPGSINIMIPPEKAAKIK